MYTYIGSSEDVSLQDTAPLFAFTQTLHTYFHTLHIPVYIIAHTNNVYMHADVITKNMYTCVHKLRMHGLAQGMCMHMYMCICMCMCMYICICICVCMYV